MAPMKNIPRGKIFTMPSICKIIFLLCLSTFILQFTVAFAVMTGDKLESPKITQANIIMDRNTLSSINPTVVTAIPDVYHNARRIITTQVFALKEPCEVNDSHNNKRAFNCSSSSLPLEVSPKANLCGSNSRLVGESCLCNKGYRKFPFSEVCVKEEGHQCQFRQNDCSTDLTYMTCINNVCSCVDSDMFDHVTSRCVGRAGGLCYPGIKDCTLNAECANVPRTASAKRVERRDASSSSSSYYYYQTDEDQIPVSDYIHGSNSDIELSGRCQCKDGFVESQGGLCKKAYGQTCASGDECDSLNLVCNEGFCACSDALHVYDLVSKSCVALVGGKCSNGAGGTLCVKQAFCQQLNLKINGMCVCVDDAAETEVGTCAQADMTASVLPITPILMFNNNKQNGQASSRVLFDS